MIIHKIYKKTRLINNRHFLKKNNKEDLVKITFLQKSKNISLISKMKILNNVY